MQCIWITCRIFLCIFPHDIKYSATTTINFNQSRLNNEDIGYASSSKSLYVYDLTPQPQLFSGNFLIFSVWYFPANIFTLTHTVLTWQQFLSKHLQLCLQQQDLLQPLPTIKLINKWKCNVRSINVRINK